MRLLIIDNYDSFVYNVVQLIKDTAQSLKIDAKIDVFRNDVIPFDSISEYDAVIISPGPDLPENSGQLMDFIHQYFEKIPMLGICLGHQALACSVGAKLRTVRPLHGYPSHLSDLNSSDTLLSGLTSDSVVGHYHSWVIDEDTLTSEFIITSRDMDGNIMSIMHKNLPLHGLQFHPESYITTCGMTIMSNFLHLIESICLGDTKDIGCGNKL
jgi:anthranilate synthase component 2